MADSKKANPNPAANAGAPAAKAGPDTNSCKFSKCRSTVVKYGFCADHFDQFKFGLLNKNGQLVPDFEKKLDHYARQKGKLKSA